ncbi:MAG: hypothetical protein WCK89_19580 [bacterium]
MSPRKAITSCHGMSVFALIAAALALAPALSRGQVPGMTLDQQNDHYGYYTYNTHSGWQSFTAGTNGHLGAVQLWLYSTGGSSGYSGGGNWSATLRIYEGEGSSGRILAEQPISGDGALQRRSFVLDTPVRQTAGQKYTIYFGGSAVHLTVRMSVDLYSGGYSANSGYDYNFMTYVITSDWSEEAYRDTTFTTNMTVISTAAQLAQFAHLVNSGTKMSASAVELAADLNLTGHFWTPIATNGHPGGSYRFLGNGHTVRSVVIDRPNADCQGLFGYWSARIYGLTVADADIGGAIASEASRAKPPR